ncbi:MAG: aminotransferase class III-fold pyridoxal phosphate-dependent enzyme [Promethearchaeota archaeon]
MDCQKGISLWKKAKTLIPGGNQLLSKRSEMFLPNKWPSYYKKAKGVEIWDLNGNKFIDMCIMAVGACTLGYADPDVNNAVKKAIENGSMATLNCPEEVELAELLLKLHPWSGAVRYARTGGETAAIAIRIARAYSKKDKVAFCGYHGWHDWYLASNLSDNANLDGHLLKGLEPNGVPRCYRNTAIPFEYNHIEQLEEITKNNDIGTIILEPMRHQMPKNNFLRRVREIADDIGAVFIIDEISSGWRMNVGGFHLKLGINPDIAIFAKAMSNGYPMGAILGKGNIMDAAQTSFISSTYWTEAVGPTAAIATINKMLDKAVPEHLNKIGRLIGEGWKKLANKHGLDIEILPPNPLITLSLNYDKAQEIKTLFTQEMLKRGYLASLSVYVSYSHTEQIVEDYLKEVDDVFSILKDAIEKDTISDQLEGPVAHSGFQRLT